MPNIVHSLDACRADFVDRNPDLVKACVNDLAHGMKHALANCEETLEARAPALETYLLKTSEFGRDPGAAPNFPAIRTMLAIHAQESMPPKLDVAQFKGPVVRAGAVARRRLRVARWIG